MFALEVNNLTKIYRNGLGNVPTVALEEISFSVGEGEVFGLLGPNGSGKTTLFKILLGLLPPTRGKVELLGKTPRDLFVKRYLGYLPEEPCLYEFLTAFESLYFYARLCGLENGLARDRSEKLLESFGLWRVRDARLKLFSKGMLQRVGICCALINDPKILLLDEPTLGLDPLGVIETRRLFSALKSQGKTIVVSSHIIAQIEDACDRIGILHKGRLLKVLRPAAGERLEDVFVDAIRECEESGVFRAPVVRFGEGASIV